MGDSSYRSVCNKGIIQMKSFKSLDYLMLGMYIPVMIIAYRIGTFELFIVIFSLLHFFPLNYLLRKHGYLTTLDEFGMKPTPKMEELVDELFIAPFLRLTRFLKRWKVILNLLRLLLVSVLLFVLAYFVVPKVLQFPSLDLIYLQCK